jgi:hypothetical protein
MPRPSLRLRLHVLLLVGLSLLASGLPAAEPAVAAPARPTSSSASVATFLNSPEGQSFAASLLTLGASDAASAVAGHDIITGKGLSIGERLLRFAAFLPAVGLALKSLERFAPRILEALRIASRIIKGERPGAIVAELRAARGLLASDSGSLSLGRIWDRVRGVTGGRTAAETATTKALRTYFPPNRGFPGKPVRQTLSPGTRLDRYGFEGGTFAAPEGTPLPMRALTPGAASRRYGVYEVVRPLEVNAGQTAPWFGQVGLGTQYELPSSVADLVEAGLLKRVH